jgi:hypothetical protein
MCLREDLLKMYGDADFVDGLIDRKTKEGLWSPHPEAASCHKMLLYWVRLDTTLTVDEEVSNETEIKAKGELDKEPTTNFGNCQRMVLVTGVPRVDGPFGVPQGMLANPPFAKPPFNNRKNSC